MAKGRSTLLMLIFFFLKVSISLEQKCGLICDRNGQPVNELNIACSRSASNFVVSHNIPSSRGALGYIEMGVTCGTECAAILDFDYSQRQDNMTLSAQVDISDVNECTVTGCYETTGPTHYIFISTSCTFLPDLTETASQETTSEMPHHTDTVTMETTSSAEAIETTDDAPSGTSSINTLASTIPVIVFLLLLIAPTVIVIFVLSVKYQRNKNTHKTRLHQYQLQLESMINVDKFDDSFDMDAVIDKLTFSKNISASEPSLLLALDQYQVHATDALGLSKYLQPGVEMETQISSPEEPEYRSVDLIGDEEPSNFRSHDIDSLNSVSQLSLSLEENENVAGEKFETPLLHLDHRIRHEEGGYCEVEGIKTSIDSVITNENVLVLESEDYQVSTSDSGLPLLSTNLDHQLSSASEGYVDYESEHNMSDCHFRAPCSDYGEVINTSSTTFSSELPAFDQPVVSSGGYVDYESSDSSTVDSLMSENQPLAVDIESSDDTDATSQPTDVNVHGNTVVFEFGAHTISGEFDREDSESDNGSQVVVTQMSASSGDRIADSPIDVNQTTPNACIAFDFAVPSPTVKVNEETDDYVLTSANNLDIQQNASDYGKASGDYILQEPVATISSVMDNSSDYVETTDSGFSSTCFTDAVALNEDMEYCSNSGYVDSRPPFKADADSDEMMILMDLSTDSEENSSDLEEELCISDRDFTSHEAVNQTSLPYLHSSNYCLNDDASITLQKELTSTIRNDLTCLDADNYDTRSNSGYILSDSAF